MFNELLEIKPISKDEIIKKMKQKNFKRIIDHRQIVRFFYEAIKNGTYNQILKFLPVLLDDFMIALYIYIIKGKRNAY